MPDESVCAYMAFSTYLGLGASRTLAATAAALRGEGRPAPAMVPGNVKTMARQHTDTVGAAPIMIASEFDTSLPGGREEALAVRYKR